MGEQIRAVAMSENLFNAEQAKLKGMNETAAKVDLPAANANLDTIRKKVYEAANVLLVPSLDEDGGDGEVSKAKVVKFAGKTLATSTLVLLKVRLDEATSGCDLEINCEKIVVGSMLAKELKKALESV